jgi:hypothetical protein
MTFFRILLYLPLQLFYLRIYAPIMGVVNDYKHRNDPPLPPVPCQICGKPGHRERDCPRARELGY